jgi:hypothetical protein
MTSVNRSARDIISSGEGLAERQALSTEHQLEAGCAHNQALISLPINPTTWMLKANLSTQNLPQSHSSGPSGV